MKSHFCKLSNDCSPSIIFILTVTHPFIPGWIIGKEFIASFYIHGYSAGNGYPIRNEFQFSLSHGKQFISLFNRVINSNSHSDTVRVQCIVIHKRNGCIYSCLSMNTCTNQPVDIYLPAQYCPEQLTKDGNIIACNAIS